MSNSKIAYFPHEVTGSPYSQKRLGRNTMGTLTAHSTLTGTMAPTITDLTGLWLPENIFIYYRLGA